MSGMSTTSITTFRTDETSKVLPGDKTGLPLEIWQYIFSYLSTRDLCRVARVSKTWYDLSLSIDLTRWKELYLACQEWRHPYWPLSVHLDPPSWKSAYRSQHLSNRFWYRSSHQAHKAGCMTLLKRVKERQTIEVGPGKQHETLKSAFASASEYDKILVYPGIYDEQLEMSLKVPLELVGIGELGSVILVICMEYLAVSCRFSNLVLRAPWFTNFILKVRSGYLQIDNCIIEDGMMCVANPATCHIQFCTFRHATVIMQHVNSSIIRNCEFSQSDNANIVVEGYPKEEKCWAYPHLCQQTDLVFSHKEYRGCQSGLKATESTTSTLQSTFTGKSFTASTIRTLDTLSRGRAGSQDAEIDAGKIGANNQGGMNSDGGKRLNMLGAGMDIQGGVHSSGMSNGHTPHGTTGNGHTDRHTNTSYAKLGGRNVGGVGAPYVDLHTLGNANTCLGDLNQTKQNQHTAQICEVSHAEHFDNKQGSVDVCASKCNGSEDSRHPDGEWLEINDERKDWQLVGEERTENTVDDQHVNSLTENCANTDVSKTEMSHPSGVNTVTVSSASDRYTETSREHSDPQNFSPSCLLGVSDSEKISPGHTLTGKKDDHVACSPHNVHQKLSTDGHAGLESGSPSMTTTAFGVRQVSNSSNHACEFPESVTLHQSFSGDVFPQNLAPLTSGPSRYLHHNPPTLDNPHPQPTDSQQAASNSRQNDPAVYAERLRPHDGQGGGGSGGGGDGDDEAERRSQRSFHSSRHGESSSDDEDDLSILDGLESGGSSGGGSNHGNNSSSSSEDESEVEFFRANSEYDSSDAEESVIMLPHLRQKHLDASLSANAVNADVGSICSHTSPPITLSAWQDEGVLSHVHKVRGCLIHQCRMMHSKGGVMVSLQGHALVSGCDISNVSYGIRCIQNARVVVVKNRIHHCHTSGIFMRLAASGLIAGNDIHSNNEAGLDIRKNADPIVHHNRIHHGKRSGVVVLGSGRGQIRNNSIYSNNEAGIYILYGGNPSVSENHIYNGKAAGVAINEGGQGFIFDNNISGNQWGGVDIRRGSCPMVCRNTINNGLGDGIVIGDQGQGTIEHNVITDNAGCGLWLMSARRPFIHGNQIGNNGDTGVMMVNKTDIQHDGNHMLPAGTESMDHISRSLSLMGALLDDVPNPPPRCSHTTLQHNNIYHNAGHGVAVELGEKVDILYNAIYANHHDGVRLHQDSPVLLQANSISNNYGHGVLTALTPCVEITGNGIYDNHECGVLCSGTVDIKENDVVGNLGGGIHVDNNSVCQIKGNRVHVAAGPAVKLASTAGESAVKGNRFHVVSDAKDVLDLSQKAVVSENKVMHPPAAVGHDKGGNSSRSKANREPTAFSKFHFLRDPPPRPTLQPPPPPTALPAHHISAVTKLVVPSADTCHQGSKLCSIL